MDDELVIEENAEAIETEEESVLSLELTLDELDSLSATSTKLKLDETNQKVVRFLSLKKVAVMERAIKDTEVYLVSSASGTLIVKKFDSAAPQLALCDSIKANPLKWETVKEENIEGVKKTHYKAVHPVFGNLYFTSFYTLPVSK